MALHNRIVIGLLLGAAIGVAVNVRLGETPQVSWIVTNVAEPLGRVWINALMLIVIPLVLSTLVIGVAAHGSLSQLMRKVTVTLLCFVVSTLLAAIIGIALAQIIRPGLGLDPGVRQQLMETYQGESSQAMGLARTGLNVNTLVNVVPRNPIQAMANGEMLAVVFIALMIGAALTQIAAPKAKPLVSFLESLARVSMQVTAIVMRFAPYAAALLIFSLTVRFGFSLLGTLASFVVTVIGGLAIIMFAVYPIALRVIAGRSPATFFRHARTVILTAFATSSSLATLPATLKATEEDLQVPNEVAGLVVPLGATANLNGTALFATASVLFVAQVFGLELTLGQQAVVAATTVLAAIGSAGVPGGSIPLLMMVLGAVDVPMEGVAIVLGVDRLLDMCRTTVDVVGDMVTAAVVQKYASVAEGTIL